MRRLFTITLLFGLLFSAPALGATPGGGRSEREPSAAQTLQQGIDLYRAGKTEEALSRLRGFVVRHPESPLLSEAYLYLARIFAEKGQHQEALLYVGRIPPERRGAGAQLIEGVALVSQGEAGRALKILQNIPVDSLSPEDRRLRLSALADANARTGKSLTALTFLRRAMEEAGPKEAESLLQQAHLLLRDRLGEAELAEAATQYDGTPLGEDAHLQQALRAFARGERETARTLALKIVRGSVPFPYRRDAVLLLERLREGSAERAVGVILPLSGRYGSFGGLVRRGMELALQLHGESGVQFLFTDAEGEAERSGQAVAEHASDRRIMAIAGPLTSASAAAAAARAEQEKIPLLSLSQREGLPQLGDNVFRLSLTANAQVQTLVEHAMGEKGMTTFAILAPENRLGKEMGDMFAREVEKRGGRVVVRLGYPENATDFKSQVKELQGQGQGAREASRSAAEKKEPVTFQALFIPDHASRIALVAPQLAYYGLQGVQLLGTNGWNSPELTRLSGRSVEGAVFVDGFFRDSPNSAVREFVALYQEKFGSDPSILEAQGFDVASILLSVLADPSVRTREDLRRALSRLDRYPGVTGTTTFDKEGEARKSLFLLQVRGGGIVQIN